VNGVAREEEEEDEDGGSRGEGKEGNDFPLRHCVAPKGGASGVRGRGGRIGDSRIVGRDHGYFLYQAVSKLKSQTTPDGMRLQWSSRAARCCIQSQQVNNGGLPDMKLSMYTMASNAMVERERTRLHRRPRLNVPRGTDSYLRSSCVSPSNVSSPQ